MTLKRIVLKKVPAEICHNCGEYYLSDAVTEQVLEKAELTMNNGTELEILRYAVYGFPGKSNTDL